MGPVFPDSLSAGIHLQVVVDNLKKFRRLRKPAGLKFRPDRHVVDANLERSCRHELTFDGVTHEEDHHARIHLKKMLSNQFRIGRFLQDHN